MACLLLITYFWKQLILLLFWFVCMKRVFSIHLRMQQGKVAIMSKMVGRQRAQIIFDKAELHYDFGPQHPMQPTRLVALMDLLEKSGLWQPTNEQTRLPFRPAT